MRISYCFAKGLKINFYVNQYDVLVGSATK